MASAQRVVVVDGLAETEEVLKAVLEPRGLSVERVRAHASHSVNRPAETPNLVVLHADDAVPARRPAWDGVPRVIIGSASVPGCDHARGDSRYLQKPFCYRELIRAIDELLADGG